MTEPDERSGGATHESAAEGATAPEDRVHEGAAGEHPELSRDLLAWAPPGLERIQGDLWLVARKCMVSGVLLTIPLILSLSLPQSPHGLGPLGQAWWITLLTTLAGLVLFSDAVVALFRLVRRSARAVGEGYSPTVVGLVVSDRARDAGFLLQGARVYSELTPDERRWTSRLRLWTPLLYLLAGLWLSFGFGALTLLAARGAVSAVGIAAGTLLPTLAVAFAGLALSALEGSLVRKAKKAWFKRPWTADLAIADAADWRAAATESGTAGVVAVSGSSAWPLRASLIAVIVAAVVAVLPPATLVPASSVGPILSAVGAFPFLGARARIARVEVYRAYRLPPDPSVSAQEAGEILNTLTYVGRPTERVEGFLPPAREYPTPLYPDSAPPGWRTEIDPFWSDSVWVAVEAGLTGPQLAYLREVASHPAIGEMSRLSGGAAADVVGGRYARPFDSSTIFFSVPIPRYASLRRAANVHLGTAALRMAEGRSDEAERMTREVISVGFLLIDDSPFLIGAFVGRVLAERGGIALERVLRTAGRTAEADVLEAAAEASARAVSLVTPRREQEVSGQAFLQTLPPIVTDTSVTRSVRWEYLGIVSALTPCLNLQRVVFGPGDDHERWLEEARDGLVRFPADDELFDVMVRGFGTTNQPNLLARVMAVSMGGLDKRGSCAHLLSTLPDLM